MAETVYVSNIAVELNKTLDLVDTQVITIRREEG